ncbi:inositol monophosphatase family protein [Aurantibacillus circumpalustris]|uniref:inositol monophosphatase family protein n=1 Tax=Aurantibacillus circumpalustris TaxID=3036359 RepID=UPI00295B50F3|nr:inositol monophosphatase family protein [Aurantibacillus circumpalustris]
MLDENILEQVIATAKKAGAFIRRERENFNYSKVEIKGLNDLVSYVDKTAEEIIVKDLQLIYKDAGFIVEENTLNEKKEFNWIVDPLDGTTNFIHGIPSYAVSIALEHKGEILLGVVYEVSRDECFSAQKNGGAFLNGIKIKVSQRLTLSDSLIASGFPIYNFDRLENYLNALKYFIRHTHGVRRIGAAAVDLCYLACGRVDAFFEYNLKPWDVAAGALIVQEAGGSVCDFSGKDNWLFGKEISATNNLLTKEFNKVIKRFF